MPKPGWLLAYLYGCPGDRRRSYNQQSHEQPCNASESCCKKQPDACPDYRWITAVNNDGEHRRVATMRALPIRFVRHRRTKCGSQTAHIYRFRCGEWPRAGTRQIKRGRHNLLSLGSFSRRNSHCVVQAQGGKNADSLPERRGPAGDRGKALENLDKHEMDGRREWSVGLQPWRSRGGHVARGFARQCSAPVGTPGRYRHLRRAVPRRSPLGDARLERGKQFVDDGKLLSAALTWAFARPHHAKFCVSGLEL